MVTTKSYPDLITSKLIPSSDDPYIDDRWADRKDSTLRYTTLAYPLKMYTELGQQKFEEKDMVRVVFELGKDERQTVLALHSYMEGMLSSSERKRRDVSFVPSWEKLKRNCMYAHQHEEEYEGYEMRAIVTPLKRYYVIWLHHPDVEKKDWYFFSEGIQENSRWKEETPYSFEEFQSFLEEEK